LTWLFTDSLAQLVLRAATGIDGQVSLVPLGLTGRVTGSRSNRHRVNGIIQDLPDLPEHWIDWCYRAYWGYRD